MYWRIRRNQNGSSELKHYGVKGMKWGVINEKKSVGGKLSSRKTSVIKAIENARPGSNKLKKSTEMRLDLKRKLESNGIKNLPKDNGYC